MMGMRMMSMIRRLSAGIEMIFVVHFRFSMVYRHGELKERIRMVIITMKKKYCNGEIVGMMSRSISM